MINIFLVTKECKKTNILIHPLIHSFYIFLQQPQTQPENFLSFQSDFFSFSWLIVTTPKLRKCVMSTSCECYIATHYVAVCALTCGRPLPDLMLSWGYCQFVQFWMFSSCLGGFSHGFFSFFLQRESVLCVRKCLCVNECVKGFLHGAG